MANKIRTAFFLFALLFVFRTSASADGDIYKSVKLTVDGETKGFMTTLDTVGEVLEKEKLDINGKDIVNLPMDEKLSVSMSNNITVERSFYVTIKIDEAEKFEYEVGPRQKVGHILAEIQKVSGKEYSYNGYLTDSIEPGGTLKLSSEVVKEFVTTVKIPYDHISKVSDKLEKGVQEVVQKGEYGELTTITRVTYSGGVEVSRSIKDVIIVKEPVTEFIEVGQNDDTEETIKIKDGFIYEYVLEMEASAYSAKQPGLSKYTKTGHLAKYGVVAVDPEIIPLGTWLYIEGYGKALASDTGGSISGNKIDLCFDTVEECLIFGRKNIKVYVLE